MSKVKTGRRRSAGLQKKEMRANNVLRLIGKTIGETTALGRISSGRDASPYKVLISTILSARTRDSVTEKASDRLFSRFPDSRSLCKANPREIVRLIRPVSFFRVKARRLIQVALILEEKFHGMVPNDINDLLSLPGVGRKTANCVLVYAFRVPAIPVDVHVHRISNRIGLVKTKTPEDTEKALGRIYKKNYWLDVNERFVKFGQTVCKPIVPQCEICNVRSICAYYRSKE